MPEYITGDAKILRNQGNRCDSRFIFNLIQSAGKVERDNIIDKGDLNRPT